MANSTAAFGKFERATALEAKQQKLSIEDDERQTYRDEFEDANDLRRLLGLMVVD